MAIEFITTRDLENKKREITGKVRIAKIIEEDTAMIDFSCPECKKSKKWEERWEEPFLTGKGAGKKMNIVCPNCGAKVTVLKLKKQMAKERKREKAKKK